MTEPIERQIKRYQKKLNKIAGVETPRATASALNKTARSVIPKVVRYVSQETKVPQKFIRKKTFVSRATSRKQRAKIYGYAQAIPVVSLLKTKQLLKGARRGTNKRGVRVAGRQYDGAFINVLRKSGRFQVLKRLGKGRYPLEVIKIPIEKEYERALEFFSRQKMRDDFPLLLKRDLQYRYRKYRAK
ncbi:hypothetical protein TDB9533_01234 [Thalassocella blandensis]|nr:hypothetical protein TDB9533_01234 [Thalassocella blandensis]